MIICPYDHAVPKRANAGRVVAAGVCNCLASKDPELALVLPTANPIGLAVLNPVVVADDAVIRKAEPDIVSCGPFAAEPPGIDIDRGSKRVGV